MLAAVPLTRQAAHQPGRLQPALQRRQVHAGGRHHRLPPAGAPAGRPHHPAHRGRDNGIGMSEEFQKVLFEPFTQEGRNDVSEMRGSGLGLAITKKLIDLMGGTIRVTSAVGKGTTFRSTSSSTACPRRAGRRRNPPAAPPAGATPSGAGTSCCARITRSTRRSPGHLLEDQGMLVTRRRRPGGAWSAFPPPPSAISTAS
jgi:hypothetical protein